MAQKSQMSDGAADFHEMIRKVYEENKYKEERKDEKNYDDQIEDLFHSDNISTDLGTFQPLKRQHGKRRCRKDLRDSDWPDRRGKSPEGGQAAVPVPGQRLPTQNPDAAG